MREHTRIAVVEIEALRETVRVVICEGFDKQGPAARTEEVQYKDTDRLSISHVAEYLRVSTTTVKRIRYLNRYNLSGKPRRTIAQLQRAINIRKSKKMVPVS
jgi:transcriptional antiterminator